MLGIDLPPAERAQRINSGLVLNPSWPSDFSEEVAEGLAKLAAIVTVEFELNLEALRRLQDLWACIEAIAADEIADWALDVSCQAHTAGDQPAPMVLAVGATVYATGEVNFSVQLKGMETALWLGHTLELDRLSPGAARG